MKVLMSSTSYPENKTDWHGIFIKDMVDSIANHQTISLLVWAPPGTIHNKAHYVASKKEAVWLKNLMSQGGIAHLLRSSKSVGLVTAFKLIYQLRQVYQRHSDVDIYHINWLQNALPLGLIKQGRTKQAALITVLGSDMGLLKLPGMVFLLRTVLKKRPVIITPNAQWMTHDLEKYFGDIAEIRPIPFGIKDYWYQLKRDVDNNNPKKWLVVIRLTKKKIGMLFDWGQNFFHDQHELHLFGPNQESLEIPDWVQYHGATNPQELQDEWFPYATGLITLSQHDEGRPQVMLEAMAAGLPIIASSIEAHENFISHKETGLLINSEKDFYEGINWLSDVNNNKQISAQAKKWVKNELGTWDDCAKRYIKAYNDLMEQT